MTAALRLADPREEWQQWCQQEASRYVPRIVPADEREQYAKVTSLRQFALDCGVRWEPIGRKERARETASKERQALNRWERFTRPADWKYDWWPGPTLASLEQMSDGYLDEIWKAMEAGGLAPATVDSTRSHLLTILRHAVKVQAISRFPNGYREKATPRTKIYTPAEVQGAMEALAPDVHLQAAFWLALHIGPRTEDLFLLKWSSFVEDHKGRMLVDFQAIKTRKLQCVPIAATAWERINELPRLDAYVFPGLSNPACADPEKSYEARLRNKLAKRLLARAGITYDKPWQVARATCNERFESHRPGVGQFILGHSLQGVNARNYRQPTEAVHEAVRTLPPYTQGLQKRLF